MNPTALTPAQALPLLASLTVVDVRSPGEYASGHLPGAHNVPLDELPLAVPALRSAAERDGLLLVCASGARSERARTALAAEGVEAAGLAGGTAAWTRQGLAVERPEGAGRAVWAMDRQVRFAAGSLVLAGLAAGLATPRARLLSAGVAGGLVFSAATNTCGMAAALSRLPFNRPRHSGLPATLAALAATGA